jgi:predicted protein tyrosine phosphatase
MRHEQTAQRHGGAPYRDDARLDVRSRGVRADAHCRVSEEDLRWADIVFAMEGEHQLWMATRFEELPLPPIAVLDIPDEFEVMDSKLVMILRAAIDEKIDALILAKKKTPNKAPEPTTGAVTVRAPSSTSRASPGRGSS